MDARQTRTADGVHTLLEQILSRQVVKRTVETACGMRSFCDASSYAWPEPVLANRRLVLIIKVRVFTHW